METQKITLRSVTRLLNERLKQEKADLLEHEQIAEFLAKIEGQKLSARIANKLPEGWKYDNRAGMHHIVMPSGQSHLIGYDYASYNPEKCTGMVKASIFDDLDSWACAGSKGRISQIEGFLNNEGKLKDMVHNFAAIQKAMNQLKQFNEIIEGGQLDSYYNPAYYELIKMAGANSQLMQDIKYNKLTKE